MDHRTDGELDLIRAFARGDESAFETLYSLHYPKVLNLAYRILGDADAAEDVAQDVFLKFYTSPRSYKPNAKFGTWLYRVTHNACIDAIRRRGKTAPLETGFHAGSEFDPQRSAEAAEVSEAVRRAIAALPLNQRSALALHRYEGLSYREIAEVLQTSVPAVESLLSRARASLRTALAPWVADEDS